MSTGASQHDGKGGRREDRHEDLSGRRLPSIREEYVIESKLFDLKYTVVGAAKEQKVASLTIETKHPDISTFAPVFSLTPALRDVYERSPRTLEQIVNVGVSEETRREALGVIVSDIVKSKRLAQELQKSIAPRPPTVSNDGAHDEFEPSFSITTEHTTTFSDFVLGQCRKEVSVFRNEQPVVRFVVVQSSSAVVSAEIHAVPIQVRWPLIDRQGEAVTMESSNEAIHDFTVLLRKARGAPWGVAIHQVAQELENRQRVRLDSTGAFYAEPFLYQVMASVPEEELWGENSGLTPVSPALAPQRRNVKPVVLSDNRVLWVGAERAGLGSGLSKITFVGFSSCGSEYQVDLVGPRSAERKLRSIHKQLLVATSWPLVCQGVAKALSVTGVRSEFKVSQDPDTYPRSINLAIKEMQSAVPGVRVTLGGAALQAGCDEEQKISRVESLLRGRAPFAVEVAGPTPATSFRLECVLDEELSGSVSATNGFGQRVTLEISGDAKTRADRANALNCFLTTAHTNPAELREQMMCTPKSFYQVHDVGEPHAMHVVDLAATLWQRELTRAGHLKDGASPLDVPWWIEKLSGSRVNLSILPSEGGPLRWDMHHSMVVSRHGVEAVYVSRGERTLLGLLRGACITPREGMRSLTRDDLSVLLRLLSSAHAFPSQTDVETSISASLPHLELRRGIGMRQSDPQRDDRDIVHIVRNWLGKVFGV